MAELPPLPGQPGSADAGSTGATKLCPRCAETVQAAASACRFCGLDFRTMTVPVSVPAPPSKTNGLAIASMVLGIVWIYWIGSVLALIFGYQAKKQIDSSGGREGGRGMAIAGIVLGWVGVGSLLLIIVVAIVVSATGHSSCVGTGC